MPRLIESAAVTEAVAGLCRDTAINMAPDVTAALTEALEREESKLGRQVLKHMLENAAIAREEGIPICQDTGFVIVFAELGQEVIVKGALPTEAIDAGIRQAYTTHFLRKSVVAEPLFDRVNTGDNTPAVVHFQIVPGDGLKLTVLLKGGGSESVGRAAVLKPAEGVEGVKRFVLDTVEAAGPNPCPPLIIGIGVGGTLDHAGYLAKKALLRPIPEPHAATKIAALEGELLAAVNRTGIGPAGMGGRVTALAVHVETYATHIAALPVAVDLSCYALRRKSAVL